MADKMMDGDGGPTPARARRTDPETSHAAAAGVTLKLTENRAAVLRMFGDGDKLTDEEIRRIYRIRNRLDGTTTYPPQSDSGLRTRRSELVKMGLLYDTGERVRNDAGNMCIVWGRVKEGV